MKTLIEKSKNYSKLTFSFVIIFALLLILVFYNFKIIKSNTQHQQFVEKFYTQIILLNDLKYNVQHQLHEAHTLIHKKENSEELEHLEDKALKGFNKIEKHIKLNPQYNLGQTKKEIEYLQKLKNEYALLSKQLKDILNESKKSNGQKTQEKFDQFIKNSFQNSFELNLNLAIAEEKRELTELRVAAQRNNKEEILILWALIGISFCSYIVAQKILKSSTITKNDLKRINQILQKEVAQKVETESHAQDERQNLYNILDSLPMAFHLQAPDYSVPFANKVFRERFGENLEKPCYELMHNRSEPCEVCTTFKVFDHKKIETSVWDAQDGNTYLTVCTPFTDMDGSSLVMEMALDITEQETAKRQAEITMEEAEKASHAKSDFLAKMSHELRTPLNSILGFSQLLLMDQINTLQPIQKENVGRILKGGQHLLALINEVLDLATIESGSPNLNIENISLGYLIQQVHELIEPMTTKENISLHSSMEEGQDIIALADRIRFKQVLLNLASNALKYNQSNGEISIVCHQPQDGKVKISISDTGIGISEKNLDIIFEPFQRIESSSVDIEGTGIGLSISKQLIKAMKGNIEVESELGKGSCFNIFLPAGEGMDKSYNPAQIIEPVLLKSRLNSGKNYKILYIEDNLANMELVGCALFRSDIKFLQAPDARMGIDIAKAHQPDLILMDINLPGMDGYEALKIIRQDPTIGSTPIFALSANSMEADILKGLQSGFDEYIPKPLKIPDFVEKVNSILV